MWAMMPALSSAAPRPYSRPSFSTAAKGSVSHNASSPAGWTSWWAYRRIVGLPSAAGRRATTAGPPGVPSGLSQPRIWTSSRPESRSSTATASALRSRGDLSKLGQAIPGIATRSLRRVRVWSKERSIAARRSSVAAAARQGGVTGKGAPTPTRKAQEAARRRPLVPADRKASKAAERQAIQDQRQKMRQALDTGDEKFLPLRDKGPQKRFARDFVDARFSLGEYLMFGALVFVLVSLVVPASSDMMIYVLGGFWVMFLAVFVDVFILSRKLRKRLAEKFGEVERGTVWYGSMRSLQFRKLRLPKPQVKRGEYPA